MEIASQDEAVSAKLARLTARVEGLEDRNPDLLGGDHSEPVKPKKANTKALTEAFKRRLEFLIGLDATLGQLADAYRGLVEVNAEIMASLAASGAGTKQFRGDLGGMPERALILQCLGEMKIVDDRRLDRSVPCSKLEDLAAIHEKILAVVKGTYDEPQTPPPVVLTRIGTSVATL